VSDYDDYSVDQLADRVMSDHAYITTRLTNHRLLDPAQESFLADRARAGDHGAREMLITHNVQLVVAIAQRFRPNHSNFTAGGLDYADLVQEGSIGLTRAAGHFEPGQGATFATYATKAIYRQIIRAITDLEDTIRLPREVRTLVGRIRDVEEDRTLRGLARPTQQELAAALEVSLSDIKRAKEAASVSTSLNKLVGEDQSTELMELQADPSAHDFVDEIQQYSPEQIRSAIARLKPRERKIINDRFFENKEFKAIGRELGVSPERVRLQERRALGRLRQQLTLAAKAKPIRPQISPPAAANQSIGGMRL